MAKKEEKPIDEDFLKGLIAQNAFPSKAIMVQEKEPESPEADQEDLPDKPKEESKRKKGKMPDYENCFFQPTPSQARDGKSITIRKEFHERISLIVRVIGKDKISLFDYVDNVLAQHFEAYQDEINELYRKNTDKLF